MKKLLLALVLVAGTFFCNAQWFVGGNIGFGLTSGDNIPTATTFEFNPFGGYMFAKTLGVGLDLNYGLTNNKTVEEFELLGTSMTTNVKGTAWKVAPFFRWVFGNFNRVKLYADAKVSFEGGKGKTFIKSGEGETTIDGAKTFTWGIAVVPGIKFMLNDHISMNGKLNLLSLGYSQDKVKSPGENGIVTTKTNNFGIGVNDKTAISLGFIYTF